MEEIINYLKQSIEDDILSKGEKKTVRELLLQNPLSQEQQNFLYHTLYDLANQKANDHNYRFVIEWLHRTSSALSSVNTTNASAPKSEVFFSPGESCRNTIINQINNAKVCLRLCIFTISDDQITNAIITAAKRGLDIKIITDNDKSLDLGSDILRFAKSGLSIKMDNTPDHMHHKFMVIDNQRVLTGSYNWTRSASRVNHENILLTSEEIVVKAFIAEFAKLWDVMSAYVRK